MVTTLLITVAASLPLAEVYSRPHGIYATGCMEALPSRADFCPVSRHSENDRDGDWQRERHSWREIPSHQRRSGQSKYLGLFRLMSSRLSANVHMLATDMAQ
jgi:hypothetical protein